MLLIPFATAPSFRAYDPWHYSARRGLCQRSHVLPANEPTHHYHRDDQNCAPARSAASNDFFSRTLVAKISCHALRAKALARVFAAHLPSPAVQCTPISDHCLVLLLSLQRNYKPIRPNATIPARWSTSASDNPSIGLPPSNALGPPSPPVREFDRRAACSSRAAHHALVNIYSTPTASG